jgi:hypothetical protein
MAKKPVNDDAATAHDDGDQAVGGDADTNAPARERAARDPEIVAMERISRALGDLGADAKLRVINWVADRIGAVPAKVTTTITPIAEGNAPVPQG